MSKNGKRRTVLDVDEALELDRPLVRFRGEVYPLRDMTLHERLASMRDVQRRQAEMAEAVAQGDDDSAAREMELFQDILADSVRGVLVGVPDDVAQSVTEREFRALTKAVAYARDVSPAPDPVVKEEAEPKPE